VIALPDSLPEELRQRWLRHKAGVQALRAREQEAALATANDLRHYPGYYLAAVARTRELLATHADRPALLWAWEQWDRIFQSGGLPQVLAMFTNAAANQELLSSSPFYVMRPPLPENEFYQAYAPA
jgi:hypothetical protein